jgi:NADH-quinone oxidoreductase subunit J
MNGIIEQWPLLAPLVLGGLAIWLLLPRDRVRGWGLGTLCGVAALLGFSRQFGPAAGESARNVLFYLFGGGAVVSGVLMITNRNPVYSALWFALATLSVCGIFVLNSAQFLAAATVIVYAGAIVVTFLFVIMLAQQAGGAEYDRRAYQPELATIGGCLLLGGLLFTLQGWSRGNGAEGAGQFLKQPDGITANLLSEPQPWNAGNVIGESDLGTLRGVGRSLFGDYLYAVELAGTALLIATIGTIALAPRRSQGTL